MKRGITIFCVICMLVGILQPMVFAEKDNDLEKAIKIAKTKFQIPESLSKFDYDVQSLKDTKIWNMCWSSDNDKDGSINISINSKGDVLSYYVYKYGNYNENTLPKYKKEDAKKIAEKFINKVDEKLLSQLKYEEDNRGRGSYRFYYTRMVNQIPFYEDNVIVEINSETGEVSSFYRNWTDDVVFPKGENTISMEKAQNAFKEKLGLKLAYKYAYEKEKIKPYLVYTTKYNNNYCIEAFTGEKVKIEYPIFYGRAEDAAKEETKEVANVSLNPEELKAVNEVSKLLSKEAVEKIARNTEILNLKGFKLSNANLGRDWPVREAFTWHLSFNKEREENGQKVYDYVNVGMDATTGKIKNFYLSDDYKGKDTAVYDKEASKKEADKFLKSFIPEKYSQTAYVENENDIETVKKPLFYHFVYTRQVNNIEFEDNYISVGFNAVTGKITSFDTRWFDLNFSSAKNIASIDKAYEKMFKEIGLKLQYKNKAGNIRFQEQNKENEIKLVYAISSEKPAIFDAETLTILNYDGKPYKEEKEIAYIDIAGNDAEEEIQALAECGIGFEEDTFKPNQKIIQKDFFRLFVKTLNYYGSTEKEDEIYDYLIREEILKENEKLPNGTLTKEDCVKFMIRALKYEEVAKIKGIYNYPFTDMKEASSELMGHITIANGLGIIKGNNGVFGPKKELTRGEAAVIIYQYLKR